MTTRITEKLEAQIERLVREHLVGQQLAVKAAIERAFATTTAVSRGVVKPPYRRSTEVAKLAEQLFDAVRACPGETMTVLAARVGETGRALERPMMHLKKSGRVRSAGERNFTRYFPMASAKSA